MKAYLSLRHLLLFLTLQGSIRWTQHSWYRLLQLSNARIAHLKQMFCVMCSFSNTTLCFFSTIWQRFPSSYSNKTLCDVFRKRSRGTTILLHIYNTFKVLTMRTLALRQQWKYCSFRAFIVRYIFVQLSNFIYQLPCKRLVVMKQMKMVRIWKHFLVMFYTVSGILQLNMYKPWNTSWDICQSKPLNELMNFSFRNASSYLEYYSTDRFWSNDSCLYKIVPPH